MSILNTKNLKSLSLGLAALAVVVSPAAASAIVNDSPDTAPTITAAVGEAINVTASNPGNINITPVSGGAMTSISHDVTVSSNVAAGYNLTLANGDTTLTLAGPNANTIAQSANPVGTPADLANNTWGFAIAGGTGFEASYAVETNQTASTTNWAGVPTVGTPFNIRSTTAVANAQATTVWYAVKADTTKQAGSYTDTVLYTGTTK